ncbi:MAG: cupin domain-containing protein [Clostridia bacterium]|nr:cupin domain-containing protein [Clostridia bacterium]
MQLIQILTPDFCYPDERGLLVQICRGGYSQINAVFSKKGAVRGNMHYHKHTREAFFILSGRVRVTAERGAEKEERVFGTGDMFGVGPYVKHTFEYLEDTYLTVLYTSPVDGPDGVRDIYTD